MVTELEVLKSVICLLLFGSLNFQQHTVAHPAGKGKSSPLFVALGLENGYPLEFKNSNLKTEGNLVLTGNWKDKDKEE